MAEAERSERQPAQQQPQFAVDTSQLSTIYTNFCHVTSLPEELVLDFGLNTQMTPSPNVPIKLNSRVVMNFFTAKRLLQGLHMAVHRHETMFGPLELDVQKRVRGPLPPTAPGQV
ncbi:MAG: DUF3467 domain-containing protein [Gemmataceae bacterium]